MFTLREGGHGILQSTPPPQSSNSCASEDLVAAGWQLREATAKKRNRIRNVKLNLPENINARDIKAIKGLAANIDPNDSPDDIALSLRNFRLNTVGLATKDFGTIHEYPSYPTDIDIVSFQQLLDNDAGLAHGVIFGKDADGDNRIFADESITTTPAWKDLLREIAATELNNAPSYNDTTERTRLRIDYADMTEDGDTIIGIGSDELNGYIIKKNATGKTALIVDTIATDTYVDIYVVGDVVTAMTWAQANAYTIYRSPVKLLQWQASNGVTPLVRWRAVETLKKLIVLYSEPDGTRRIPVQINKRAAFTLFKDNEAASPYVSFPAGFYLDTYGYCTEFQEQGTALLPVLPADGQVTKDIKGVDGTSVFMQIKLTVTSTTGIQRDANYLTRLFGYITLVYRSGESDPVYRFYAASATAETSPTCTFAIAINPALLDREIIGMRFYGRAYTTAEIQAATAELLRLDTEATLIKDIDFTEEQTAISVSTAGGANCIQIVDFFTVAQSTWQLEPIKIWTPIKTITFHLPNQAVVGTSPTITDLLNHAIDRNRSYHTPRFIVGASRNQGDILATDESDKKLRFTVYDGYGAHCEDNYPDMSVDNQGNRLFASLVGRGKIMGLVSSGNSILVLRENETERYNLDIGGSDILEPDCCAADSVVQTPHGTAWAGTSGIWWAPRNGGTPYLINKAIQNEHDGRLTLSDGVTPIVTEEARNNIKGGYNASFSEIWFQYEVNIEGGGTEHVCKRYFIPEASTQEDGQWIERKLGEAIEAIQFATSKDNKLLIITADSILVYPNIEGAYSYLDAVEIDTDGEAVADTGQGMELSATLALGSIANQAAGSLLHGIRINHKGKTVSKLGKYLVEVFLDKRTTASSLVYQRIDREPTYITLERIGSIKLFKVKVSIPPNTREDLKTFAISSITHFSKKGETVHA